MPSRTAPGLGWLPAALTATVAGVATGLAFWFFLPNPQEARELPLAQAAQKALAGQAHQPSVREIAGGESQGPISVAEHLCRQVTGVPLALADCRLGRPLRREGLPSGPVSVSGPVSGPVLDADTLRQSQDFLDRKREGYAAVRNAFTGALPAADSHWLWAGFEQRLLRLAAVSELPKPSYGDLFEALLSAEGMRYDSSSGLFSVQRWDIARLLEKPEQFLVQAERRMFIVQWLPVAAALATFALVFVSAWLLGGVAALVTIAFGVIAGLGLLVVADASLRFGQGSPVYLLNPFSYALERQLGVVAGVLILPVGGLLLAGIWGHRLSVALQAIRRRFGLLVVMSLGATTALYSLVGPAAGSEALKLSVCLFAGLVTAGYARQTFLARKVMPDLFSLRSIVESLGALFAPSPEPRARAAIHASLVRAYLGLLALGLGTLAAAALVFSDFGGTLVSAIVFTALIFILFGLRLALFFLLVGGIAGFLALLTDKVQSRIQLMLDPMTASVSDFARLIKFSEAAQPHGYGLGSVRWCSFEGACLPIQALSDYFPVLLSGALGGYGALTIFFVLVAIYIGLMARAVLGFASGLGVVSVAYAISFFLLLAALSQTVITYFGNWRLAPLTGLGLPLMSLGWSSMIAATLGLSLLAIALRLTPIGPGATRV
jgi:cell division protein FtsW (lipid II flippase)